VSRERGNQDLDMDQHHHIWRDVPGHKHGKLFISKPCKKRAEDLLKLSRHQLRMVVAILTGHAPVRTDLCTMGRMVVAILTGHAPVRTHLRTMGRKVVAILTGHAPVRTHLRTMGLFEGDAALRFCGQEAETVQHIICRCEAMACWRFNIFGDLVVEPKVIRIATVRDLCLFIRTIRLLNLSRSGILGLHNKPMAAVHSGQYADGP
jgi:hypothetical protein